MSVLPTDPSDTGTDDHAMSVYANIHLRRQLASLLLTYGGIVSKFGVSPDSPEWGRKLHEAMRHPDPGCWVVERSHKSGQPEDWVGRLIWCGYRQEIPLWWNQESMGAFSEPAKMTCIVFNLAGHLVTWRDAVVLWLPDAMGDIDAFFSKQPGVATQAREQRILRGAPWVQAMRDAYTLEEDDE